MLSELHLGIWYAGRGVAQQLEKRCEQNGRQQEKLTIAKKMLDAHESKSKAHQFTDLIWVEIEALMREEERSQNPKNLLARSVYSSDFPSRKPRSVGTVVLLGDDLSISQEVSFSHP